MSLGLINQQLVESNGMEVFSRYFRRLLLGNAPQIFPGIHKNVENPGNYPLLVQEMDKIIQDPEQAPKIAEIIDTSEGDMYRDFDLSTFMDHFRLDSLAKTLLASAFLHVSKPDLKTKGRSSSSLSTCAPCLYVKLTMLSGDNTCRRIHYPSSNPGKCT